METIVAPITPMINAPVIVIRISGADALKVTEFLYNDGGRCGELKPNSCNKFTFSSEKADVKDDVIVSFFKAPRSYTGLDVVEISFHGNPIIVRKALNAVYSLGIRAALPGEFTKQAFLNGKLDLTQAEAVQELIASKNAQGVNCAYNQLQGFLRGHLDRIKESFLDLTSLITAKIDFPEEDTGDDDQAHFTGIMKNIKKDCDELVRNYKSVRGKEKGYSIAIAGKANVGKSSLMNALLDEERAIVSAVPGTTRDYIKENLYFATCPIQIFDTAGIRVSDDSIETEGVKKSYELVENADVILAVFDVSNPLDKEDFDVLKLLDGKKVITVGNKCDLGVSCGDFKTDINISAKNRLHIEDLKYLIEKETAGLDSDKLSDNVTVTERHVFILEKISDTLESLISNYGMLSMDMISIDIQECISGFREITGEEYTEDILDRIFSKFCIGK